MAEEILNEEQEEIVDNSKFYMFTEEEKAMILAIENYEERINDENNENIVIILKPYSDEFNQLVYENTRINSIGFDNFCCTNEISQEDFDADVVIARKYLSDVYNKI